MIPNGETPLPLQNHTSNKKTLPKASSNGRILLMIRKLYIEFPWGWNTSSLVTISKELQSSISGPELVTKSTGLLINWIK